MSRPLRIQYENAWYHVMNRGSGHRNIFNDDADKKAFLDLLENISDEFGIEIHGYCLMDNHYHLLIRTPEANLSRAMRHLGGVYTQRYNYKNETDGPLFRGRYKAILIEEENYLVNVSRYIHLNPSEAGIVKNARHYEWSSYKYYITSSVKSNWLISNKILSYFNDNRDDYQTFISSGNNEETKYFYSQKRIPPIFGSKSFIEKITDIFENDADNYEISEKDFLLRNSPIDFDTINNIVAEYYNAPVDTILNHSSGKNNLPRKVAIYLSHSLRKHRLTDIAQKYGQISYSAVSKNHSLFSKELANNKKLQNDITSIKKKLEAV